MWRGGPRGGEKPFCVASMQGLIQIMAMRPSQFLFYILTIMCSVTLGTSPVLSAFLCMLRTGPALVAVGEFLLCACLEQHRHIVCGL